MVAPPAASQGPSSAGAADIEQYAASLLEVFADPATPEQVVLDKGLVSAKLVTAALSRPNKSARMIWAIITAVNDSTFVSVARANQILVELTSEPELDTAHLTEMARAGWYYASPALKVALAGHPDADADVVVSMMVATTAEVAQAAGQLLPAACWLALNTTPTGDWVGSARAWRKAVPALAAALEARWANWAGSDPARLAFLLTSWMRFTSTDEMLAVGDALLSERQPTRGA